MKIEQSMGLTAGLTVFAQEQRLPDKTKTGLELARQIFAEAEQREQPFLYQTPEGWARKWLESKKFHLMRIPLNAAALPCLPKNENLVLKKIHAKEENPIVVDGNKRNVGASLHGFTPEVIVLDGKHRHQAAMLRGETHILAWVGENVIHAAGGAGGGFGGGLGSGGGPPQGTAMAPGSKMTSSSKKQKKIQADEYKSKLYAKHPPGCENVVNGLKKKFGEDSSSVYKIAWSKHGKGEC